MSDSPPRPIEIFFSYAHEDEDLVGAVRGQLSLYDRQKLIRKWHDREIPPGAEWKGIIDAHLSTADIILLFVSFDFFKSDYCYDVEMTAALERHRRGEARVVPIILRPSTWEAAPFAALNVLPTDGVPVTKWPNRDDACLDIAKGVVLVVQEHLTKVANGYEFAVEVRCGHCSGSLTFSRVLTSLMRTAGIELGPTGVRVTQRAQ